jgi:hypothetical protein
LAFIALLLIPISKPLWRVAPELKFLQFPWRWLLVAGVAAAILVATAVSDLMTNLKKQWLQVAIPLAFACLLAGVAAKVYWQPCDDEDAVSAQLATFLAGDGFEGTDEYTPRGADNGAVQRGLPPVRVLMRASDDAVDSSTEQNPEWKGSGWLMPATQVEVRDWAPEHKTIEVQASARGFAVLRLMDYPAWRVRVNGVEIGTRPHRDDGLMAIPVTAGVSHIELRYQATADVYWGLGLSCAAVLVLIALLEREKKWQKLQILLRRWT